MTADVASPTLSVVHVITGLRMGGAERHVQRLATLGRHANRVVALYEDGPVGEELRRAGVPVHLLCPRPPGDQARSPRPGQLAAILRLTALLRRWRPDVVHVHLLSGQAIGLPAARLAGVPVRVSTEHSVMDGEIEGRPATGGLRLLYRVLERLSSRTVAVSATTRRRLVRDWGLAGDRIEVIGLGVDLDRMAHRPQERSAARARLGISPGEVVTGAVGRLAPVKRFDVLLRAMIPLLRTRQYRLVIVGEGELWPALAELVHREGLADRVLMTGPRDDLHRLLNAFDVFASTSRAETFGLAVVEALANGLPTVVEQCPAVDDLELRCDALVRVPHPLPEPDEAEQLRAAIVRLGGLGRRPAAPALQRYSARARVRDVDDLYERLLAGGPVNPAWIPASAGSSGSAGPTA